MSVNFINSTYCYDIEMENAMELHDNREATVVPVMLRSCLWEHTPFSKLQALPQDAKAVTAWADRDEALTNVAAGIRRVGGVDSSRKRIAHAAQQGAQLMWDIAFALRFDSASQ